MYRENLNRIVGAVALGIVLACGLGIWIYFYYFTPEYSRVGYQPSQVISFSHKVHNGQLNIDCRYCHYLVEESSIAGMPESTLCMNCHNQALARDDRLSYIRKSIASSSAVYYTRVNRVADYVWFNHAVHTRRGIGCVNCHGNVQEMDKTYQSKSLSMKLCLDCHRNPAQWIVPLDKVTQPLAAQNHINLIKEWNIRTSDECSQCHR